MVKVVNDSATVNVSQLVGTEDGTILYNISITGPSTLPLISIGKLLKGSNPCITSFKECRHDQVKV